MTESTDNKDGRGMLRRLWDWFWRPTAVLSVGFTLIVGFLAGILFWGGFHWSLELTNTEEFCVSCHSMETNLGEYRETIHYNNHSGVRAICSDCHVPNEWNHKVKAKVMAVKDVYHELVGSISTSEKYEERRLHMAAAVWKKMKASDSRECRNCHNFDYMDFTIQEARAADEHQRAIDNDMTCIDCHQGIAHNLPQGYQEEYQKVVKALDGQPTQKLRQSAMADKKAISDFLAGQSDETAKGKYMLNFLGTLAGNILSLPGILGLAFGLMTRNFYLAAGVGALVGVLETLLFAGFNFGNVEFLDLFVAVLVGTAAGAVGCAIRIKGTTV